MKPIDTNEYNFLVGEYDTMGTFWCSSEHTNEYEARASFEYFHNNRPRSHAVLIQQIKMHKVIETHYPTK